MTESTETTRCWVVSPMLDDTESFVRLRTETTDACGAEGLHVELRHVVIDDSAGTDPDIHVLDDVEVFRTMFRVLTGTTIRSGNFAAQRGDSLAVTIGHPSFDLCYSSTLLALRRPTATVPCARGHRFAGSSGMNTYSLIAHGVRMLLAFSERIAVRMMAVASVSAAVLVAFLLALASGVSGDSIAPATLSVLIALLSLFATSFAAFIVLFSGFTQSSAMATLGVGPPDQPRTRS